MIIDENDRKEMSKQSQPKKVDVLRGQEHLRDIPAKIEKMWYETHELHRMWHAFYPDGHSEVIMFALPGLSETDGKNAEARVIQEMCNAKKPSALLNISEAWTWASKTKSEPDVQRMMNDPAYYAWYKTQCVKKETLFVSIETSLGAIMYMWEILREDGKEPRLDKMEILDGDEGGPTGRFQSFLLKVPE